MELMTLLLLVAFRNRILEPDLDGGRLRCAGIIGKNVEPDDFRVALAQALVAGYVRDPVRLPEGALQCHWHLELTPEGVARVRAVLRHYGKSADELIASARSLP